MNDLAFKVAMGILIGLLASGVAFTITALILVLGGTWFIP